MDIVATLEEQHLEIINVKPLHRKKILAEAKKLKGKDKTKKKKKENEKTGPAEIDRRCTDSIAISDTNNSSLKDRLSMLREETIGAPEQYEVPKR